MITLSDLIERGVREKGLSREDTRYIAESLNNLEGNALRHAIMVVGYSYDPSYKVYLEPYLTNSHKPAIASEVIRVLCKDFGLARRYSDFIKQGIKGFGWDHVGVVKNQCLSAAGQLLSLQDDKDLASAVFESLLEKDGQSRNSFATDAAQVALGATPSERAYTSFEANPDLVDRFKRRFLNSSGST